MTHLLEGLSSGPGFDEFVVVAAEQDQIVECCVAALVIQTGQSSLNHTEYLGCAPLDLLHETTVLTPTDIF